MCVYNMYVLEDIHAYLLLDVGRENSYMRNA